MAQLTVLYRKTKVQLGSLELDASVREEHVLNSTPTKHPIERGAKVTDHINLEPEEITIEGVITATPARQMPRLEAEEARQSVSDSFETLKSLRESQSPITVVTALATYTDMVIKSLRVPRSAKAGHALRFTVVLEKLTIVESQTVPLPSTALAGGKPKQKGGKKQAAEASPVVEESGLSRLDAWAGGPLRNLTSSLQGN